MSRIPATVRQKPGPPLATAAGEAWPDGLVVEPIAGSGGGRAAGRLSAFTVDVEDWYQSCVDLDAPITERVVRNVDRILEVLDAAGVKGTFFVQGRVAETFPDMVAAVAAEGHEVQSHGYSHRALYTMDRAELRRELEYAKNSVEDAAGIRVTAFRAPDFSILSGNLWALDVLAEAGFEVDSSLFPARTSRYGIAGWEVGPHRLLLPNGAELLEVPVAIWELAGRRVPVGGGGYCRLLPRVVLERGLQGIQDRDRPAILYFHPYEFSADELDDYRGQVALSRRFSQSLGRKALVERLTRLLQRFPFGRFDETLRSWELPVSPALERSASG
jgi:polysaccharide deacetylase family protein (PEP-CTERM system associated)